MYCECFKSGNNCKDCGCVGCKNTDGEQNERKQAVKKAKSRDETAFDTDFSYKGCRCTKTQCMKNYCDCFLQGHTCGKYCKCIDCGNRATAKGKKNSSSAVMIKQNSWFFPIISKAKYNVILMIKISVNFMYGHYHSFQDKPSFSAIKEHIGSWTFQRILRNCSYWAIVKLIPLSIVFGICGVVTASQSSIMIAHCI